MKQEDNEMVKRIISRWHVPSFEGLTVEQAALDIGILIGMLLRVDDEYVQRSKN